MKKARYAVILLTQDAEPEVVQRTILFTDDLGEARDTVTELSEDPDCCYTIFDHDIGDYISF